MNNTEILESLQTIANRLDTRRIITDYTSNEGSVAARSALSLLNKFVANEYEEPFVAKCKAELERSIEINEAYVLKKKGSFANPSECPIATQHAIEYFLLDVGYKSF